LEQKTVNDFRTFDLIGAETEPPKVATLAELIEQYKTDPVSDYHKLRYATRVNHDSLMARMVADCGHLPLAKIRRRTLEQMHLHWSGQGTKIPMGHGFMSKLRTIAGYGSRMLEDMECVRLYHALEGTKYEMMEKVGESFMTAEQAITIREKAREYGYYSIALAQAFQFDCLLRQRDTIGEWVPLAEKGESDTFWHGQKWIRGLRWEEIDADLVLTHVTSKKQKKLVVPLSAAPMVMKELHLMPDFMKTRTGPIIVSEATTMPWVAAEFRRKWRMIADDAGIPDDVKNMHSRHGGLSEGSDAGIPLEHMRHAATHSDIATTQRYSRNSEHKVAEALRRRVAYRQTQQGDAQ
jgi:hypothetical protein